MKRTFTKYPSNYVRASESRYTDDSINQDREYRYQSYLNKEKRKAQMLAEGKLSPETDSTGYWRATMRYYPEDGGRMEEYYAFTTGYDRDEARFNLYDDDLEQSDWHDSCLCLTPISEEEYLDGVRRYNNGERWGGR